MAVAPTSTVLYAPTQSGWYNSGLNSWNETDPLVLQTNVSTIGLVFDIYDTEAERGLPLDPFGYTTMSLTVQQVAGTTFFGTFFVRSVTGLDGTGDNGTRPVPYDNGTYIPGLTVDGSPRAEDTNARVLGSLLTVGTTSRQTIPLSWTSDTGAVTGEAARVHTFLRDRMSETPGWNGRIAVTVSWSSGFTTNLENSADLSPRLQIVQWPFWTGVAGAKARHERVRAVRDSRYGFPTFHDKVVQDELREGLYVFPWDVDPDEERTEYIPSSGEGTREDDVPL